MFKEKITKHVLKQSSIDFTKIKNKKNHSSIEFISAMTVIGMFKQSYIEFISVKTVIGMFTALYPLTEGFLLLLSTRSDMHSLQEGPIKSSIGKKMGLR